MRIIISPAKQMRTDTDASAGLTMPVFLEKTEILTRWIRSLSYEEQKKLWACNDKIARQNNEQYDYVIICPNPKCRAELAVTIKAFHSPRHGFVNVPIIGTVIS